MPAETPVAPAVDPKQTAANIAKGVQAKAAGKSAAPQTQAGQDAVAKDDKAQADKPAAEAAVADPNAGKEKYVVEGREIWLTPQQARAYVQKGIAFEPRVSELARLQQEVNQFQRALLDSPGLILANMAKRAGVPIETIVQKVLAGNANEGTKKAVGEWYYENEVKLAQMDPKDRELLEKDNRIKELEMTEKQKADEAIKAENVAKVQRAMAEVKAQIKDTLGELGITNMDTAAGVRISKEIADVMRLSYLQKEPCTAKQAAEKVKTRIIEYQKQFFDSLDPEKLVETLGKENAEKVRKHFLKLVKNQEEEREKKPATPKARRNERETIGMDDFHDYLNELKQKG